jgi:hypothetical protein
MLDPESLGSRVGLACPKCGAALSLKDLFGLSAAFSEEEGPDLTLDDLVGGPAKPSKPTPAPATASPGTALEAMRSLKKR